MPSLNKLHCSVELTDSRKRFKEYGIVYGDGVVESVIASPSEPKHFEIHLSSSGFIASGLAMFVFIDGVRQCNRHRLGLMMASENVPDEKTLVDFRVRQKEEVQNDTTLVANQWMFEERSFGTANDHLSAGSTTSTDMGTIEVFVLRCIALAEYSPTPEASPAILSVTQPKSILKRPKVHFEPVTTLGGPDHAFGLDGQSWEPDGQSGGQSGRRRRYSAGNGKIPERHRNRPNRRAHTFPPVHGPTSIRKILNGMNPRYTLETRDRRDSKGSRSSNTDSDASSAFSMTPSYTSTASSTRDLYGCGSGWPSISNRPQPPYTSSLQKQVTHSKGVVGVGHVGVENRVPGTAGTYNFTHEQESTAPEGNAPSKRPVLSSEEQRSLQAQTMGSTLSNIQDRLQRLQSTNETKRANSSTEVPRDVSWTTHRDSSDAEVMKQPRVRLCESKNFEHPISRPHYLDNFASPYALFRFKYCPGTMLRKLFGDDALTVSDIAPDNGEQAIRDQLRKLTKEEVVERFLKLRAATNTN